MLKDLFFLFYPDVCASCKKALFKNEFAICTACLLKLPYSETFSWEQGKLDAIFYGRVELRKVWSYLEFNKGTRVQNILHSLKYKGNSGVGVELGRQMGQKLSEIITDRPVDYILPVPLHKSKLRKRGYNQAFMLAKGVAEKLGVQVQEKWLLKQLATDTQTKRSRFSRWQNMKEVFVLNQDTPNLNGCRLLLVDDVITTGATIEACAQVLKEKFPHSELLVVSLAFA